MFQRFELQLAYLRRFMCAAAIVATSNSIAKAVDDLPPAAHRDVTYADDVAPILTKHCLKCHGPKLQESGLRVDQKASLLRGGDFGEPAIVAGNSGASFLIQVIAGFNEDLKMPPKGPQLTATELGVLRKWIDMGIPWPGQADATELTTDHWSFQPIQRPAVPMNRSSWVRNDIDSFILDALEQQGLQPSPTASPVQLLRRLRLVEHGLPPTKAQISRFKHSKDYATLVNEILSSEHYGERWSRHWLDLVRFGETTGFEVNRERANAWPYRDYVIESLNSDKPYDQFVLEQLAGDVLDAPRATGFLVAGPNDLVKSQDPVFRKLQRQDELADMINTTGTTFLGLTIGCARCHSHKFDPISQKDYYSLQAVFAGVNHAEREMPMTLDTQNQRQKVAAEIESIDENLSRYVVTPELRESVTAKSNEERFAAIRTRFVRFTILRSTGGEPCIDELSVFAESRNVSLSNLGVKATASTEYPNNPKHKISHINDGIVGNSHSWISAENGTGWIQLEFPEPIEIDRIQWARDREGKYQDRLAVEYKIEIALQPGQWTTVATHQNRLPYNKNAAATVVSYDFSQVVAKQRSLLEESVVQLQTLRQQMTYLSKSQMVYAGTFTTPPAVFRLYRGDPLAPREQMNPDAIQILGSLGLTSDAPEKQRRERLGKWIVAPENPLTARVIVNRIWQHCFGLGIVDTPSDFGAAGTLPTHPELLDYLACELRENQWSLKHIHRLILESATFRQASTPRAMPLKKDGDSRYLWRFPPRRLEAEAIRDSILAVSGALSLRRGGPGFSGFEVEMENVRHYFPIEQYGPEHWRRMIYQTKVRQEQDGVFGVFDCPDASQVVAKRSRSTTPLQALNLLNSKFVIQQAQIMSKRLLVEAPESTVGQVRAAYIYFYAREPTAAEVKDCKGFVEQYGLAALCRVLFNSNEFLFVQ
jgi:mono/diheme cytochrome c family protein